MASGYQIIVEVCITISGGTEFQNFIEVTSNKKVVAFGATVFMQVIADNYSELQLGERISYIIDNNPDKAGSCYYVGGRKKIIYPVDHLLEDDLSDVVILIGSDGYALEMYEQLQKEQSLSEVSCFLLPMMIMNRVDDTCANIAIQDKEKIPKIIHCFWFSGDEKDELSKKCIESWRRFCPDYEIKEWNTTNYDVTKNSYMYEAYKARKWAYVTDYARLDMVHEYGGFYFDFDLELVRSVDSLLGAKFVTGFGPIRDVELAAFGAEKGCELIARLIEEYENRVFEVGRALTLKDVQPVFMDSFMKKNGFEINGRFQNIDGNILLPRDSFSTRNWFTGEIEALDTSFGVHHCAGGWVSKDAVNKKQMAMKKLKNMLG